MTSVIWIHIRLNWTYLTYIKIAHWVYSRQSVWSELYTRETCMVVHNPSTSVFFPVAFFYIHKISIISPIQQNLASVFWKLFLVEWKFNQLFVRSHELRNCRVTESTAALQLLIAQLLYSWSLLRSSSTAHFSGAFQLSTAYLLIAQLLLSCSLLSCPSEREFSFSSDVENSAASDNKILS